MPSVPLERIQYRDLDSPDPDAIIDGATGHAESVTDIERYLIPLARIGAASNRSWGVVDGLRVTAVRGQRGLTVGPGVGLDAEGHLVVLAARGTVIVDPNVDPTDAQHVPTVVVPAAGVVLPTAVPDGEYALTLTWREVMGGPATAQVLKHAPWVRLLRVAAVPEDGSQVIAARVTVAGGTVSALSNTGRRLAGMVGGRLELRVPTQSPDAALAVDHVAAGELAVRPSGALELTALPPNSPPRTALSLHPGTGNLSLVPAGGSVGIGLGTDAPARPLHVEGTEVHSGGAGAGFSFADRSASVADQRAALVNTPTRGERFAWFAQGGVARLWSGRDLIKIDLRTPGGGLDVWRRMRLHKGSDESAGIFFTNEADADRGFVGLRSNTEVGLFGVGVGWGFLMNVDDGTVTVEKQLNVKGRSCAQSFCNLSDARLKTDVAVVERPLERLDRLRGVSFRWSAEGEPGVGVIAQEVAEVFPQLVSTVGEPRHLAVDYAGLTAVLVEAVKELAVANRSIRARLTALEPA